MALETLNAIFVRGLIRKVGHRCSRTDLYYRLKPGGAWDKALRNEKKVEKVNPPAPVVQPVAPTLPVKKVGIGHDLRITTQIFQPEVNGISLDPRLALGGQMDPMAMHSLLVAMQAQAQMQVQAQQQAHQQAMLQEQQQQMMKMEMQRQQQAAQQQAQMQLMQREQQRMGQMPAQFMDQRLAAAMMGMAPAQQLDPRMMEMLAQAQMAAQHQVNQFSRRKIAEKIVLAPKITSFLNQPNSHFSSLKVFKSKFFRCLIYFSWSSAPE